jgi:Tat protein secretion system quality control protein TatD with DNase activity
MAQHTSKEAFPWHIGVYDAHCHPTDTMSSIEAIPSMNARVLTIMATRAQDQDLVTSVADKFAIKSTKAKEWKEEECVLPCFGWHPWFSHQMYVSDGDGNKTRLEGESKLRHYQSVLAPEREELSDEDRHAFSSLPDPLPFKEFLLQTKANLQRYPLSLVGEIGLDRSFRIPESWIPELEEKRDQGLTPGGREGRKLSQYRVGLQHQKKIFKMQLQLAAELDKAVSIHGVQAHGMVFETLRELYAGHEKKVLSKRERKKLDQEQLHDFETSQEARHDPEKPPPYPPRICLHSYSGDPSNFKQYTNPAIPIKIFASFSTAVNLSDEIDKETPKRFENMIEAVPDHMLLVESDIHTAGDAMDERLEDIVRRICKVKGWGLEEGVTILGNNWRSFAFGI